MVKTWEYYYIMTTDLNIGHAELNRKGKKGWVLVSVTLEAAQYTFFLKRQTGAFE